MEEGGPASEDCGKQAESVIEGDEVALCATQRSKGGSLREGESGPWDSGKHARSFSFAC